LSDAEIQGRALAQKILSQRPKENYTNTGVLQIRNARGERLEVPVEVRIELTDAGWVNSYMTISTNVGLPDDWVKITHIKGKNLYWSGYLDSTNVEFNKGRIPDPTEPFATSDYWLCDLGLEFFHWPGQKVLKKEFHRQCPCTVLESTNPNPAPNAYSRVVCWIDNDSLGIVEAYAYDARGRKLKNFYPKNLEKVNGQYQVESMVMENLQTGSRSVLEFDLNK
jgi:hypothetical protein